MAPAGPRKWVNANEDSEIVPTSRAGGVDSNTSSETRALDNQNDNRTSWYTRTWPHKPKAPAVAEVARESISAETILTTERNLSTSTPPNKNQPARAPSIGLTKKIGGSTRSLPAEVATTRINIASIRSPSVSDTLISGKGVGCDIQHNTSDGSAPVLTTVSTEAQKDQVTKELGGMVAQDTVPDSNQEGKENQHAHPSQTSGWIGWIPLPKIGGQSTAKIEHTEQSAKPGVVAEELNKEEPLPHAPEEETESSNVERLAAAVDPKSTAPEVPAPKKRGWLQVWGGYPTSSQQVENRQNEGPVKKGGEDVSEPGARNKSSIAKPSATDSQMESNMEPPSDENVDLKAPPSDTAKPSSWFFWSRDTQIKHATTSAERPEPTEDTTNPPSEDQASASIRVSESEPSAVATETQPKQTPKDTVLSDRQAKPSTKKPIAPSKEKSSATKITFPNQVLPALRDNFPVQERAGIIRQLGSFLFYCNNTEPRHVKLTNYAPRVKQALAIGVHGFFPAPLIRTVLGQPTGTSVKFSTMAAKAIHSWTESHGFACEIQKISLEGEGRISERVDLLWKLLLNYIEYIKKADFILVACHSQGVPVAVMLVAKLIAFGCVSSARIGICAMAGVNLGPFPDYRSRWISGSAGELFDFANPDSKVSQDYMSALETALDFGVRIVYVGSIDDQLVSLESSIFAPVSHPHIYRAVFVDGRVHAPSFLSHLVSFAMKLRNLGISDHGLIRELSSPLAGSLYSGEGHSRLYDDEALYRLAVEFTLETLPVPNAKLEISKSSRSPNANPYILPFAMRGVLEEEFVRRELSDETAEILKLFDEWKPTSKVLKDVKFRLEGIRSKL
ncbi:conserved hypothetical protein [Histoplasma capsulatum H143]|uniref:YMC020W-like alpha/beta hydrolase domain-containing protein n=1 Tax=Ajellomyces capsulatus (strain H143) TaxID=544712 RepID=C6HKW8_AJECH|nr:conserved hypothetical protein [Histoplasma capsulatum H143]